MELRLEEISVVKLITRTLYKQLRQLDHSDLTLPSLSTPAVCPDAMSTLFGWTARLQCKRDYRDGKRLKEKKRQVLNRPLIQMTHILIFII